MDGRAFLVSARHLLRRPTEANRRSAVSRGYFAVLNEARAALERWGFAVAFGADIDASVFSHFNMALNIDALRVADSLGRLRDNRRVADYSLSGSGNFADEIQVRHLLQLAQTGIDVLDQLEEDTARRAIALAAIRAAFP